MKVYEREHTLHFSTVDLPSNDLNYIQTWFPSQQCQLIVSIPSCIRVRSNTCIEIAEELDRNRKQDYKR